MQLRQYVNMLPEMQNQYYRWILDRKKLAECLENE